MIQYHFETEFKLKPIAKFSDWINGIIRHYQFLPGTLNYIFCDDAYLLELNKKYLSHDTYTDIITFDYTTENQLSGDIFLSVERIRENAGIYGVEFKEELLRVMSHGLLHLMGYKDKTEADSEIMREKENECIEMFHVEP
jgi:rRNA maturation RNase YbeY